MTIELNPKIKRLLKKRVKAGGYSSLEDVIVAGLAALDQQEAFTNLSSDALAKRVAKGDKSVAEEGTFTLAESYRRHLEHRFSALKA